MNTNIESEARMPILDLEIQDIEGVGPTTAKKLKEAGIVSVMDLAVTSAEEPSTDLNSSNESAAAFIISVQNLLEILISYRTSLLLMTRLSKRDDRCCDFLQDLGPWMNSCWEE
jgi:hypothetical protein